MLHLNSGFERLLFKSRRTLLPKPTRVTQRHMDARHFPTWRSSYPFSICEAQRLVYQKWFGRAEMPVTYLWKRPLNSKQPPKTQHTETRSSPKRGAPATRLMDAAGRVASPHAELPASTEILLSGLSEAQEESVTPLVREGTPVSPLAGKTRAGSGACGAGS